MKFIFSASQSFAKPFLLSSKLFPSAPSPLPRAPLWATPLGEKHKVINPRLHSSCSSSLTRDTAKVMQIGVDKSTRLWWLQIPAWSLCNAACYLTLLNLSFPISEGRKTVTTSKGHQQSGEDGRTMPGTLADGRCSRNLYPFPLITL